MVKEKKFAMVRFDLIKPKHYVLVKGELINIE